MPKYFHDGTALSPTLIERDGKTFARVPEGYRTGGQSEIECDRRSILLSTGTAFFVIPPGGSIMLPLPPEVVKKLSPNLLTEEEAHKSGLFPVEKSSDHPRPPATEKREKGK